MGFFEGKVAVVTGAGSGIGRALALDLASRGARVAISDVDTIGLDETAERLRRAGAEIHSRPLDVSQREEVYAYADEVRDHFGVVHQIYNNAGVAFIGDVLEMDDKSLDRVMDIDFFGVANGTTAFLPHVIDSGDGAVVNVSSVFGLFAVPSQSAYNAAKFAVRGYTEALAMELRAAGHPVRVTCVHPGGVRTNIVRNADSAGGRGGPRLNAAFDRITMTTSERASRTILRGVEKGRTRVLVGADAHVLNLASRALGTALNPVVRRAAASPLR